MKIKLTLFVLFFCFQNLCAQILFEPMIGFKKMNLRGINYGRGSCQSRDYSPKHNFLEEYLTLGLNTGIEINNSITMNINGTFSTQIEPYCDRGIAGFTQMRFQSYTFQFLPKYQIRNFIFGTGINSGFHNAQLGRKDPNSWLTSPNLFKHVGWSLSFGYIIRPILIELRYMDSRIIGERMQHRFDQTQSMELILAYRFRS